MASRGVLIIAPGGRPRLDKPGSVNAISLSPVASANQSFVLLSVFLFVAIALHAAAAIHSVQATAAGQFSHWVLNEETGLIEQVPSTKFPGNAQIRNARGLNLHVNYGSANTAKKTASTHIDVQALKDGAGIGAVAAIKPLDEASSSYEVQYGGKRQRSVPEPALAVLFDRYGGVDKALEVLKQSATTSPSDPVVLSDLGNAYRVKGESELAIECFQTALRIMPHPDFYLNLGGVHFALGELEEAVQMFTAGLQLNPAHALLQFSLGGVYAVLGRKDDARRCFLATLRIQPDFEPATQYLSQLKSEIKQPWWRMGFVGWMLLGGFLIALVAVQRLVHYSVMRKPHQGVARPQSIHFQSPTGGAPAGSPSRHSEHGKARLRRGSQ